MEITYTILGYGYFYFFFFLIPAFFFLSSTRIPTFLLNFYVDYGQYYLAPLH